MNTKHLNLSCLTEPHLNLSVILSGVCRFLHSQVSLGIFNLQFQYIRPIYSIFDWFLFKFVTVLILSQAIY